MVDPFKALGWLNAIDNCSRLNREDRQLLRRVGHLGLFDSRIEPVLERLRNAAHSPCDPLRRAEILLYCAAIGNSRGWWPQAARDAREAVLSYENDHHRRAVALWILGTTQWPMLQHPNAYGNWAEARRIFKKCQDQLQGPLSEKGWYQDPIWQMETELVACPDEIATWLNRFEPSSLGIRTGQVANRARKKISERSYPSIYVLMQDLQEAIQCSERIFERAEIYLEFGLATYQMGNSHFAMELLRKSVLYFHPGIGTYHKQAVARCMLGAMEWMHNLSQNQAAADWLLCIDEFEYLRGWADRDHWHEKEKWYSERCGILRSALLERVEPPKQSAPPNDTPAENSPASRPWTPRPGKTDLYQEFLSKVGWDREIADRLIEYERKKAPAADRNELIRRAIESLMRDNQ